MNDAAGLRGMASALGLSTPAGLMPLPSSIGTWLSKLTCMQDHPAKGSPTWPRAPHHPRAPSQQRWIQSCRQDLASQASPPLQSPGMEVTANSAFSSLTEVLPSCNISFDPPTPELLDLRVSREPTALRPVRPCSEPWPCPALCTGSSLWNRKTLRTVHNV